ncbi:unnamed protein product [Phytomonas sp. EM1]|nr:unnamed protein product [Phytomonas sp. EM1]|eukprot:CCW63948.1 unnamed protein product [Phytomonas sp. isolate EM1]
MNGERGLMTLGARPHASAFPSVGHFRPRRSQSSPAWPVTGKRRLDSCSPNPDESSPRNEHDHLDPPRKVLREARRAERGVSYSTETSACSSSMRSILERIRQIVHSDEKRHRGLAQSLPAGDGIHHEGLPSARDSVASEAVGSHREAANAHPNPSLRLHRSPRMVSTALQTSREGGRGNKGGEREGEGRRVASDGGEASAPSGMTSRSCGDSPSVIWECESDKNRLPASTQPRRGELPPRPTPRPAIYPKPLMHSPGDGGEKTLPRGAMASTNTTLLDSSRSANDVEPRVRSPVGHEWCCEMQERLLKEQRRQQARTDSLREGLTELCAAVQEDMRRLEDRLQDALRGVADNGKAPPPSGGTALLLQALQEASPLERKALARLLMPELKSLIQDEIHTAIRFVHHHQQQQSLEELESRLRAYIDQKTAAMSPTCAPVQPLPSLLKEFPSVEQLDARIRDVVRSIRSATDSPVLPGEAATTASFAQLDRRVRALEEGLRGLSVGLAKTTRREDGASSSSYSEESEERRAWRRFSQLPSSSAAFSPDGVDAVRLEVVQPALDHVRRLLVAHQKLLEGMVEQRCVRTEHAMESTLHVWEQGVVGLRSRLNSLRRDVRGALVELSQNLNVACPGI